MSDNPKSTTSKRKATPEEIRDGWREVFSYIFADAAVWLLCSILGCVTVAVFGFFGAGISVFDVGIAAGLLILLALCAGWYYPARIIMRWLRRRLNKRG